MNSMPKKLREELSNDPFYSRCANTCKECSGRTTWEHAIYYAGKQVQDWWAIVPLCEFHHSVGAYQQKGGLKKRWNEWVALGRLFTSKPAFIEKEFKKYPKAKFEWKRKYLFLSKLYGRYQPTQRDGEVYWKTKKEN